MRGSGIVRYPGGKQKLKTEILGRIKRYYDNNNCYNTCEYIEPFFGAGSIGCSLMTATPIKQIYMNDKDAGMAALWTAVLWLPEELCKAVDTFVPSTEDFYAFKEFLRKQTTISLASFVCSEMAGRFVNTNDIFTKEMVINNVVDIALKKLAIHQMSYSGLGTVAGGPIGGQSQGSNYKIDCRWSPSHIKNKIRKTNKLFNNVFIRYYRCTSYDWTSILVDCEKRFPEKNKNYDCFIYLDPPYYKKGPELYQFYFSEQDHVDMSQCLKKMSHPWLLSYDNTDEIRKLYDWAKIKEVAINYTINTSRNNTELLITSPQYSYLLEDITICEDIFKEK
jgi:DNA adenine methylase